MDREENDNNTPLETLNRFYNDLYDKELSLKFNDAEVTDINDAVTEFVSKIVKTVGDRNPCLKISDVISVGSAKEGTQICTPCEYDFLLILEKLSRPGAISITKGCPDSLSYVHVKLENTRLERSFKDIIQDGCLKSTQDYRNYVYRENGLRQKLRSALQSAATENMPLEVTTASGSLSFKTTNIEAHGPAFMTMLRWQSVSNGDIMDISVDLCPAIRVSEHLERLVSPESVTCQSHYEYAQRIGSALLIPCRRGVACNDGLCFKVAFTETELLLMANLSEHHKKCYKVLKYLLNGRPVPSMTSKSVFKKLYFSRFYNYPTEIHSYALKVLIWNHHFQSMCGEQHCLSSCIDKLFIQIKAILEFNEKRASREVCIQKMLPCPFNKYTSIWSKPKSKDKQPYVHLHQKGFLKDRFLSLTESLQKVSVMDNYNFEDVQIVTVNNPQQKEKLWLIFGHVYMFGIGLLPGLIL